MKLNGVCPHLISFKTFKMLNMRYSRYKNESNGKAGHLWQGRFYSSVIDERHLYASVRYVENNPVRAGMVEFADQYKWSSAKAHVSRTDDPVLSGDCHLVDHIRDWKEYLREDDDRDTIETLMKNTKTGRPCGDDMFVKYVEGLLGRKLGSGKMGRPCKEMH